MSWRVERWRATIVPTIKRTTATYYENTLRAHIIPAFPGKQISAITRFDVESFLADRGRMYCRNTLRGMRASLGRVLSWAVEHEWLEKNPCSGVKLPHAGERIERTIFTPTQVSEIANKLNEPYATLVLFLAITGLRIGEAVGVKRSDFDGDVLLRTASDLRRQGRHNENQKIGARPSDSRCPPFAPLFHQRTRMDLRVPRPSPTPVNPGNALKRYVFARRFAC